MKQVERLVVVFGEEENKDALLKELEVDGSTEPVQQHYNEL